MDQLSIPIRILYRDLETEIKLLYFRWQLFQRLFENDQATLDVMNQSAPYFFVVLNRDLLDTIASAIGRLLDPTISFNNNNASMQQLIDSLGGLHPELTDKLIKHRANAEKAAEGIIKWRNKRSAHRDLGVILKKHKLGFNIADVTNTIAEMDSFLIEFEKIFQDDRFSPAPELSVEERTKQDEEFKKYAVLAPLSFRMYHFVGDGDQLIKLLESALHTQSASKRKSMR